MSERTSFCAHCVVFIDPGSRVLGAASGYCSLRVEYVYSALSMCLFLCGDNFLKIMLSPICMGTDYAWPHPHQRQY